MLKPASEASAKKDKIFQKRALNLRSFGLKQFQNITGIINRSMYENQIVDEEQAGMDFSGGIARLIDFN